MSALPKKELMKNKKHKKPQEVSALPAIVVEAVSPCIDHGRFLAKTVQGKPFYVEADIFKDGHEIIKAALLMKGINEEKWQSVPMTLINNDHWQGFFIPPENKCYEYTIEAWYDPMATWMDHVEKKAGQYTNIQSEVDEGLKLFKEMNHQCQPKDKKTIVYLQKLFAMSEGASEEVLRITTKKELKDLVTKYPIKYQVTRYHQRLTVMVDRERAVFGAWYELFPRSQGTTAGKSGTFKDCMGRLPYIKQMGFDVIYLPPIHPIGVTNRKGENNSLTVTENSPGSPWAIGNKEGGHKAIHPELGTIKEFKEFVSQAKEMDMEIALDYAIQCSPDHPYATEHPEWFYHLPDGTIRYAENPPKKYQDIYPIDFYNKDREALWLELKSIVEFWIAAGVKIFRVDNPHTKPFYFWKWLIHEIQQAHPDVLFLAEAFTRPKPMKFLAKAGFTQSYTYFTWKTDKKSLRDYFEELTQTEMKHYFRGNLFTNTPDILHALLQDGGRPAFKMRAVLAAMLLPTWGIYSGYELCENEAKERDSEEYLNSEKYEVKVRDWNKAGNIKKFITNLNRIRKGNVALQEYTNLKFFDSANDQVLCFGKWTPDNNNIIITCVNLDPYNVQEDSVDIPLWEFGIDDWQPFEVKDLITGEKYLWQGRQQFIRLDPRLESAHIFKIRKS